MDLLVTLPTAWHIHVVETLSNPISPPPAATCWCCFAAPCLAFIVSGVTGARAACVCPQLLTGDKLCPCTDMPTHIITTGWFQKILNLSYFTHYSFIEFSYKLKPIQIPNIRRQVSPGWVLPETMSMTCVMCWSKPVYLRHFPVNWCTDVP